LFQINAFLIPLSTVKTKSQKKKTSKREGKVKRKRKKKFQSDRARAEERMSHVNKLTVAMRLLHMGRYRESACEMKQRKEEEVDKYTRISGRVLELIYTLDLDNASAGFM
jgi:hypothetical protein